MLQFSSRVYDSLTGLQVAYTLRYTAILRLSENDNRIEHEFIDDNRIHPFRWYSGLICLN